MLGRRLHGFPFSKTMYQTHKCTWSISHHAGVRIVAVLWLALSLVGGGELEGVFFAAYANREGRARLHVLFVSS